MLGKERFYDWNQTPDFQEEQEGVTLVAEDPVDFTVRGSALRHRSAPRGCWPRSFCRYSGYGS